MHVVRTEKKRLRPAGSVDGKGNQEEGNYNPHPWKPQECGTHAPFWGALNRNCRNSATAKQET
jgi:hypothetical protein